jgi:hypothetical protein
MLTTLAGRTVIVTGASRGIGKGDYPADEPRYMRRVQVMATLDYPSLVA